jgi:hypothetical protein
MRFLPLSLLASFVACSSSSSPSTTPETIPADALGGACGANVDHVDPTSRNHVPEGTQVTYATNPPSGGDHYAIWATWGVHTEPLPPGYWVHNQEHGGVVFLYKCASRAACPSLAAQVEAVAAAIPQDPICDPSVRARVVVLPDPDLPAGVQIAAAAWGYAWTATCFDGDRLRKFYDATFGHGPEDECAQGFVSDPTGDGGSDASDATDASDASDAD